MTTSITSGKINVTIIGISTFKLEVEIKFVIQSIRLVWGLGKLKTLMLLL